MQSIEITKEEVAILEDALQAHLEVIRLNRVATASVEKEISDPEIKKLILSDLAEMDKELEVTQALLEYKIQPLGGTSEKAKPYWEDGE